ncbi:MAG: DUF4250 domain-containing protein [Clostridia bacterium]
MSLPNDPMMLLSVVNTKLRDFYDSLEDFCEQENVNLQDLCEKLASIGYKFDKEQKRFR